MNKLTKLYVDQWGNRFYARTLRELRAQVGGKRPSKMYVDTKGGQTLHIGYVVGQHWLTAYEPMRVPA